MVVGAAFALILAASGTDEIGERCLSGKEQTQIRWAIDACNVHLSPFQRLEAHFAVRIDGEEVVKRGGTGHLVTWVVLRDATGRPFAIHDDLDLARYPNTTSRRELEWSVDAFFRPGAYNLTLAVVEPATGKYSFKRREFHVAALHGDPLPNLWSDLAPVEFIRPSDEPDRWFLPAVDASLRLPSSAHPARVEIVVNIAVTEQTKAPRNLYNQAMEAMLPLLKILSQAASQNGSVNVTSLDLWRQRVDFEQASVHELDWPRKATQNMIGAEELKRDDQAAQFLADQVVRRLAAPAPARIAIVISPPIRFRSDQVVTPVQIAPDPNLRVFHFSFGQHRNARPDLHTYVRSRSGHQPARYPRRGRRHGRPAETYGHAGESHGQQDQ